MSDGLWHKVPHPVVPYLSIWARPRLKTQTSVKHSPRDKNTTYQVDSGCACDVLNPQPSTRFRVARAISYPAQNRASLPQPVRTNSHPSLPSQPPNCSLPVPWASSRASRSFSPFVCLFQVPMPGPRELFVSVCRQQSQGFFVLLPGGPSPPPLIHPGGGRPGPASAEVPTSTCILLSGCP